MNDFLHEPRAIEIVREFFPDVDDAGARWILWHETGWMGCSWEREERLRDELEAVRLRRSPAR